MKKIGIVITDGVGFRNFILSDFLTEAEKKSDEVVILSCLPANVYEGLSGKAKIIELNVFQEKFITWFFRKAKELGHLQLHKKNNFGINDNLKANYSKANNPRGIATRFAFWWTTLFHSEKWIQCYNNLQQWSFKNHPITKEYLEIIQNENFDLLFVTHQRPPFIAPLLYAAEKLNVKTAAFIFSWDNLASKGRMAGNFDYYLVWSDLMKEELCYFYKTVKADNIDVVGTPQFEPYVLERYQSTKEQFYRKFNLDSSKITICYSCGDISTSKNDELYIELIANAIINKLIPNVNLIIRTSPAEDPIRFAVLVDKFPFIKWNYPKWTLSREGHQEVWSQRVPLAEDVMDLRSLLEFSDININVVSTMTLDFMIFDKPVIFPVFGNGKNGLYNDRRFLSFKHLEHVKNSNAVRIAYDKKELLKAINDTIANPSEKLRYQKELVALEIGKPLMGTSKEIVNSLVKWCKK
jgi:hypothetical protein